MKQFGRFVRVQVGTLDVSDLDVSFEIERGLGGHAGTCQLSIINLTEAHRNEIYRAPRRQTFVSVDAGYSNETGRNASRLFTGDLTRAIIEREGTDWVVKVSAGDGLHAVRAARVSRSFAAGVSLTSVVQHIAEAMGVGIGNAVEALQGASFSDGGSQFPEGTMLRGRAADELGRLTDAAGMEWSIQDGVLMILRAGAAVQRTAILLSPESGMIASPKIINRRAIEVECLIQPGLTPGQLVVVRSQVVSGTYRINHAKFKGEKRGQDWTASLTCRLPRAPLTPTVGS
ncbi:MAG: hypothetical protein EPO40_00590 [Myxococcaceae bacterium]|nr:MAG: hypothetical protein EPO40_00590 [Myxococcaceae bacterium]